MLRALSSQRRLRFWLVLFAGLLIGALVFGIATLFLRNQVRAIRRLAGAAEAFGLGRDSGPIRHGRPFCLGR